MICTFLHSLFIWPIQAFIETFYVIFTRLSKDRIGLVIVFSAIFIFVLSLPVFNALERWIRKRSNKTGLLWDKDKKAEAFLIRSNLFKKDVILKIFGIFVYILVFFQLFFAVHNYLSYASYLNDVSFLFITDLGKPDQLISLKSLKINMLPIASFVFFAISVYINKKANRNLNALINATLSLILLIVLYNAPSGLVLFWVIFSIFTLIKTLSFSVENPEKILYRFILAVCFFLLLYLFLKINKFKKSYLLAIVVFDIFIILTIILRNKIKTFLDNSKYFYLEKNLNKIFIYSCLNLFFLTGIMIPFLLVASSPLEFDNPYYMILRAFFQAASLFLLFPLFFWYLSSSSLKKILLLMSATFVLISLISFFIFTGNYGMLTPGFTFEGWEAVDKRFDFYKSITIIGISLFIVILVFHTRAGKYFKNILLYSIISMIIISGMNFYNITNEISKSKTVVGTQNRKMQEETSGEIRKVYSLTRSGKNVFIIFLDRAPGVVMSAALEFYPELSSKLDGFTWYPNTISFGPNTIIGSSALFGGYEYTPQKINERKNISLKTKINEALLLMPRAFSENNYKVTVTDPTYANLSQIPDISIYDGLKNVKAHKIIGTLRTKYHNDYGSDIKGFSNIFDYDLTMRFSLFRIIPPILRRILYYDGNWLKKTGSPIYNEAVKYYPGLLYLPELCSIENDGNSFNFLMNDITHNHRAHNRALELTQNPVIVPKEDVEKYGSRESALFLYTFTASFKTIAEWFDWLKEQNVYDNTRIIIVSDHGYFGMFQIGGLEEFNPVLMVKDFNTRGPLKKSMEFMTNADTPVIALEVLGQPLLNPFTGNVIDSKSKESEIFLSYGSSQIKDHMKNKLVIDSVVELKVKNIFSPENKLEKNIE